MCACSQCEVKKTKTIKTDTLDQICSRNSVEQSFEEFAQNLEQYYVEMKTNIARDLDMSLDNFLYKVFRDFFLNVLRC